MMRLFNKKHFQDCLPELVHVTLADGAININKIEAIINGRGLIDGEPPAIFNRDEFEALGNAIEFCISAAVLDTGLYFKAPRELALISGAGIAGLATAFELLARGFKVIIAEKRTTFNRFNIINLDVESQRFLKKFGLLDEFEKVVAGRIKAHQIVLAEEKGMRQMDYSDVSELQPSSLPLEPESFQDLFKEDGIYSVRISDLQAFLAEKALDAGAHLFGNVELDILTRTPAGGAAEVQMAGKDSLSAPVALQPKLLFVAEGTHSTTARQMGMEALEVKNECTGENWIFGNMRYSGKETFVVSLIDASGESLELANIIFNAKIGEINIAITSKESLSQALIQERILEIVRRVASFQGIDDLPQSLIKHKVVKKPVHVNNEQRVRYSRDNVFCIGDTAGHSSPLAGLGGTLGVTLVPRTIEQLLNDSEQQPHQAQHNFHRFTEAYTSRWIAKSIAVKKRCLGFFKGKDPIASHQEQTASKGSELALIAGGVHRC